MTLTPLTGHIDSTRVRFVPPGSWEFAVAGWVSHPAARIRAISAFLGSIPGHVCRCFRPDVANMLSQVEHAGEGGFHCYFPLRSTSGVDQEMSITATLDTGEKVSCKIALDLRSVRFEGEVRADSTNVYGSEEAREYHRRRCRLALKAFLSGDELLVFNTHAKPKISVVLVLFNQAELTYACLRSLLASNEVDFEVVIVDNASSDDTKALLERLRGVNVLTNESNMHFLDGANQGAGAANGELLLFLNNDAEVLPDTLSAAAACIESNPSFGAVTARIIRPDGQLQEAGCYILRDGSTFGFGVSDEPFDDRYAAQRICDYGSGAFLLTRLNLFRELSGFDRDYAPAYFEDVDYCARLLKAGYVTVYTPRAVVFHAEKSSSAKRTSAETMTAHNKRIFRRKHRAYLRVKPFPPLLNSSTPAQNKIIIIDNDYPLASEGQGFPRAELLLNGILQGGFQTVFLALNQKKVPLITAPGKNLKLIAVSGELELEARLAEHAAGAKAIVVSRSPNMERFKSVADFVPSISPSTKIIFDAEALFARRSILEAEVLRGITLSDSEKSGILQKELELADETDMVLTVSETEAQSFRNFGVRDVRILSHGVKTRVDVPGFNQRNGLLMVGPVLTAETPNADGLKWFLGEVFPLLLARLEGNIAFHHAGRLEVAELRLVTGKYFTSFGMVENLAAIYDAHRVFVAPIRFGAGIPIKVIEAAAAGVPVVATPLLAEQLDWKADEELLVASSAGEFSAACLRLLGDEKLWQHISQRARERVRREYSSDKFQAELQNILQQLS